MGISTEWVKRGGSTVVISWVGVAACLSELRCGGRGRLSELRCGGRGRLSVRATLRSDVVGVACVRN